MDKPSEIFVSPDDDELSSMMSTVIPRDNFKDTFALPNTESFSMSEHQLMLFWLPALKYMRKYYTLENDHNITINIDARDNREYYSKSMYYSINWGQSQAGDNISVITETIQFIDDDNKLHNRAGPCKIVNSMTYASIDTYRSTMHKTSGFKNHSFTMEYSVHGMTIDRERADYLASISSSFPWTSDRPMQDKEYAMFLLRFKNGK